MNFILDIFLKSNECFGTNFKGLMLGTGGVLYTVKPP